MTIRIHFNQSDLDNVISKILSGLPPETPSPDLEVIKNNFTRIFWESLLIGLDAKGSQGVPLSTIYAYTNLRDSLVARQKTDENFIDVPKENFLTIYNAFMDFQGWHANAADIIILMSEQLKLLKQENFPA